MTRELIIRPAAADDMAEGLRWYNRQRAGLGLEFIECVEQTFDALTRTPEMHQKVYKDARRAVVRRFPYVVYYRVKPTATVILAVVHALQDPRRWQSRV